MSFAAIAGGALGALGTGLGASAAGAATAGGLGALGSAAIPAAGAAAGLMGGSSVPAGATGVAGDAAGGLMDTQGWGSALTDAAGQRLGSAMSGPRSYGGSKVSMPGSGGDQTSPALINSMMNQYQQEKPYDPFEDPRIRSLMNFGRF